MPNLNKRLNAWRDDLADSALKGLVNVDLFVDGKFKLVTNATLSLRRKAGYDSPQDSQLLLGDKVKVFEIKKNWAWVQNCRDNYVGYCPADGLSDIGQEATHQVSCLRTIVFPEPDIKSCPIDFLTMTSRLTIVNTNEKFSQIETGGWVYTKHLAPLNDVESDFLATAHQFINIPYLWGGNSSLGIDCSGLVQISLRRAGIEVLRDSEMQETSIGNFIPFEGDKSILKPGDLIFWKGHVGFFCTNDMLLHANATDMMVSYSPFDEVCARILKIENNPITSVRRL